MPGAASEPTRRNSRGNATCVRSALARIGGFGDLRRARHHRHGRTAQLSQQDVAGGRAGHARASAADHRILPAALARRRADRRVSDRDAAAQRVRRAFRTKRRSLPSAAAALSDARHLVARSARATGQAVVTITTAARIRSSRESRAGAARASCRVPSALRNSFDLGSENAILGKRQRTLAGAAEIEETIAGIRYRVSAGSFFQVNVEIVARIFDALRPALQARRCGSSISTAAPARSRCSSQARVRRLRHRGELASGCRGARQRGAATACRSASGSARAAWKTRSADGEGRAALEVAQVASFSILRAKGSDEATLGAIAEARVPAVWYLSCDPATLARDLKFLAAKGYRLGIVQPFDMFPQTGHVETLATLAITANR